MRRFAALLLLATLAACGGETDADSRPGGRQGRPGGGPTGFGDSEPAAAVPVEAASVERRGIASYIETNGVLEAENEVDLVARITGPIVRLAAEEGMSVRRGQLLAQIDDRDVRADLDIARVALDEARLDYERAKKLRDERLISTEEYEQVETAFQTAEARYEGNRILLGYTEIRAPFDGLIVARYVDRAEQVSPNSPLFRISDFDPLLCLIQVPERELRRLAVGQSAYLTVEAWPGERFPAEVLRISPVVDAATGTIKVTLEVAPDPRLRPGMFGRVFLEAERRGSSIVIPKSALSLESLGDTVYVVGNGVAIRRDVELGFREGDFVEVVSGLAAGEMVVVVGQDGLADGTPIQVLQRGGAPATASATPRPDASGERSSGFGPQRTDSSQMTPEQRERAREFMRQRGLSDEEIERRLSSGERQRDQAPKAAPGDSLQ
jgi:membrane fusion protein (multidrug efflux system)